MIYWYFQTGWTGIGTVWFWEYGFNQWSLLWLWSVLILPLGLSDYHSNDYAFFPLIHTFIFCKH